MTTCEHCGGPRNFHWWVHGLNGKLIAVCFTCKIALTPRRERR